MTQQSYDALGGADKNDGNTEAPNTQATDTPPAQPETTNDQQVNDDEPIVRSDRFDA